VNNLASEIQNQELYDAMKLLIVKVSNILLKSKWKRPFADIDLLLFDHNEQIAQLPESKVCADIMQNDVIIKREFGSKFSDNAGNPVEKPGVSTIARSYFLPLLIQYFRAVEFFEINEDVFHALYLRLIRKMKEEEVERLWKPKEPFLPPLIDFIDASVLTFTLETTFAHKKGARALESSEIFNSVITILRLFKPGGVNFFFTQRTPLMWGPIEGIAYSFKQRGDFFGRGRYNLTKDEIDSFVTFWKEFRDVIVKGEFQGHNYIQIALKRLNLGLEENNLEDKLIDYFVAFEALYLLETLELSYRLSLRTATLLGDTSEERNSIFKLMKDAYALRSNIVHGKKPKIGKKIVDLKDYVPKLENYLRQSIIKFLRMPIQYRNQALILRDLDQQILR